MHVALMRDFALLNELLRVALYVLQGEGGLTCLISFTTGSCGADGRSDKQSHPG